ncbi:MAG: hypothetical protein LBS19_04435 [Clostridiales bacterium]|jgi:hypothetical protein|nr:hypothetical protein [Clostridiales bacterium]
MNIAPVLSEIGVLSVCLAVSRYPGAYYAVSSYLPAIMPDEVLARIKAFTDNIVKENKSVIFFISPEIALLESLARANWEGEAVIAVPMDLDEESRARVYANIPDGIRTRFVHEGSYPASFRPDNGVIICPGIVPNGGRHYIIPACCRMMSLYRVFQGERILLSCFLAPCPVPQNGWTYAEFDFFNRIMEA